MNSTELDALIDEIIVDAYGEDEQLCAFCQALEDALPQPADGFVIGEPVSVIAFDYDGNERRGLTARCRREDGSEHVVSAAEVGFPANINLSRYIAAYRKWMGLDPCLVGVGAPTRRKRPKAKASDLDLTSPIELVVISVKEKAARCRLLGSERVVTVRAPRFWKLVPGEITKMASAISWITGLCVDSKGDIWAATATTGGSFMRHFTFQGFNAQGVPLYSGVQGRGYEDVRFPDEGDKTNGWGMASRLDYDADRDILIAFFPAVARKGEGDKSPPQYVVARYDHWSKGHRTAKWKVKAFRPETEPDYFMYEVKLYPYSGYMGMQIAGDYVFMAYLFGEVHVFDLNTGRLVEILALGPEVNGQSAWEDAAMGLRAFRRKNGEYLIFTENSGWGGKDNFFRWRP